MRRAVVQRPLQAEYVTSFFSSLFDETRRRVACMIVKRSSWQHTAARSTSLLLLGLSLFMKLV